MQNFSILSLLVILKMYKSNIYTFLFNGKERCNMKNNSLAVVCICDYVRAFSFCGFIKSPFVCPCLAQS